MSERQLRENYAQHRGPCSFIMDFGHRPDVPRKKCDCGLQEALADDPDVVGLLRWAYEQLGYAGGGGEEAALGALIERLEKQVDLSDEPPGWEWVEEDNGTQKGCRHDNE